MQKKNRFWFFSGGSTRLLWLRCDSDFFSFSAFSHQFYYYYYCYSRSSKTIALGNWGLSSKLCFNVFRAHSIAYTATVQSFSVSFHGCVCVFGVHVRCLPSPPFGAYEISTSAIFYDYGARVDSTGTSDCHHLRIRERLKRVHVKTMRLCLYNWLS